MFIILLTISFFLYNIGAKAEEKPTFSEVEQPIKKKIIIKSTNQYQKLRKIIEQACEEVDPDRVMIFLSSDAFLQKSDVKKGIQDLLSGYYLDLEQESILDEDKINSLKNEVNQKVPAKNVAPYAQGRVPGNDNDANSGRRYRDYIINKYFSQAKKDTKNLISTILNKPSTSSLFKKFLDDLKKKGYRVVLISNNLSAGNLRPEKNAIQNADRYLSVNRIKLFSAPVKKIELDFPSYQKGKPTFFKGILHLNNLNQTQKQRAIRQFLIKIKNQDIEENVFIPNFVIFISEDYQFIQSLQTYFQNRIKDMGFLGIYKDS
jgi:hypothetical protein